MIERIAGAPITWGVCEVPDWGYQMSPERVLGEMAELGLKATELGPDGFLPTDPEELGAILDDHGLSLVGGFIPVVLHDAAGWSAALDAVEHRLDTLAACQAEVAVLAAVTGGDGYETSSELSSVEWATLRDHVANVAESAERRGLTATVHPHYGTVIETPDHIERFLEVSDVSICLDTGHILAGGGDPAALAQAVPDRVAHVHLKDVDGELAARVRAGEIGYYEAVARGMYRPLGQGDVDVASILESLDEAGYGGWYVLEQDLVLDEEPEPRSGPYDAAAASRHFLMTFPSRNKAERSGATAPSGRKEGRT